MTRVHLAIGCLVLSVFLSGCNILPTTRKLPVPKAPSNVQSAVVLNASDTIIDTFADSTVDGRTFYHFYAKSAWTLLDMPDR